MEWSEYDLDKHQQERFPSPGCCIYCLSADTLTDEHIIPYALGANTSIFLNASCKRCAETIQPYEQDVLRKQLGLFRTQVDAPSRTRSKDRPTHTDLHFMEVDDSGKPIRDLGIRSCPIAEVPIAFGQWQLPEARILRSDAMPGDDRGSAWMFHDEIKATKLARRVIEETGSRNVAVKLGDINRDNFLRFLAKTAHAFAISRLGVGTFRPFLTDIILNRSHDLSTYVGGGVPPDVDPATTTVLTLGQADDGAGKGLIVVLIQLYPLLGSPAYVVVVGEPLPGQPPLFGP